MSESPSPAAAYRLTAFHILLVSVVTQLVFVPYLWGHTSTTAQFLGRYSIHYGMGLIASVVVSLVWIILAWRYKQLESWLFKIPPMLIVGLLLLGSLGIVGIAKMGIDEHLVYFVLVNGLLAAILLIIAQPDRAVRVHWWYVAMILAAIVFYALLFVSHMVLRDYSPDEAWWADRANTFRLEGQYYARIAFYRPSPIEAGRGWIGVIHSWLLDHVAFDIRVGRIFNQLMYSLAIGGIGLVAAQLYDRATAFVSVIIVLAWSAFQMISWSAVRYTLTTGMLPVNPVQTFGEEVVERVPLRDDEMLVATFELIWVLPDKENFYAPIAEGHARNQLGWEGTQVWDYLQPDVYIEVPGRMLTPPGLQAYREREQFQQCNNFQANGYDVRVYRRLCGEEAN